MINSFPRVDVVLLSWNRVDSLLETIKNISNQVNILVEMWIIDQGSEPDQLKALKDGLFNFPTAHLIENTQNTGVPAGRNQGMKLGNADYIICLDNDAIFESEHAIEKAVTKLQQEPDTAILGFKVNNYFSRQLELSSWVYPRPLLKSADFEFMTARFCGAGHAIRRTSLQQTDYYDEALFFYWEELDLAYQMINLGFTITYFPEVVILHKTAPEKRVSWRGDRYYYLVRNGLYIQWKYYRSQTKFIARSLGYLVKGAINLMPQKAIRGIKDALKMVSGLKNTQAPLLSAQSQAYIKKYDTQPRGSLLSRIKNELIAKLPEH